MPINSIIKTLSESRLSTYKKNNLCDASDEQSLGLYLWNTQLSGHFFPILQILEVSLRNAIHNAYIESEQDTIEANYHQDEWVNEKSKIDSLWFTKIYTRQNNINGFNQISRAKKDIQNENKQENANNYIGKLTFGFWVNMTNKNHRSSNNATQSPIIELWPKLTKKVFPNAIDRFGNRLSINNINTHLHTINKLRNRIAHHEPIWKAEDLYDSNDAINKIVNDYTLCLKIIEWINSDNLKLLSIIENDKFMGGACNLQTLWKNKQLPSGLMDIPRMNDWYQSHILDTRKTGIVISADIQNALIKCNDTNKIYYTNKSFQNRKSAWPLTIGDNMIFIPRPSSSKYANATKVQPIC